MATYTTCRSCHLILDASDGEKTCDDCPKLLNHVEALAITWRDAVETGDRDLEARMASALEEADTAPARLHESALIYASWGWPVFPLKPQSKTPATRNGFQDATSDTDRIDAFWGSNPGCNVGVATGHLFDVVDVDVPGGAWTFSELEGRLSVDIHGHVATASGGCHYYVEPTGAGNAAGMAPGVDYRGLGGYVVAPPSHLGLYPNSRHRRGWSWVTHPSPVIKVSAIAV